jgi:hypothetical protein
MTELNEAELEQVTAGKEALLRLGREWLERLRPGNPPADPLRKGASR